MVRSRICLAVLVAFLGCSANVIFLEHLIKFSPGSGDLITFTQFLFVASCGFITTSNFGRKPPVVPIKEYLLAVILFFASTMTGNLALGYNISMPIQMIFKSGSVLASLILGVLLLKRNYQLSKYVSVVMISVGISICLLTSQSGNVQKPKEEMEINSDYLKWLFGIFLLVSSLFLGAGLGIVQERISTKYGKHPDEMLFYSHALALPGFLFFTSSISSQVEKFTSSDMITIPYLSLSVPIIWLYLAINILTQFVCIRSVYVLATEMSALAVTVILTVRKFVSLVISIFYFRNPFTIYHWLGTALVFTGTLLFSGVLQQLIEKILNLDNGNTKKNDVGVVSNDIKKNGGHVGCIDGKNKIE